MGRTISWAVLSVVGVLGTSALAAVPFREDPLRDKTLVAWVQLHTLDQSGSGVLSIQQGDEFDAITFGERVPRRWMAGSHMFSRTQSDEGQRTLELETVSADQWRQVAVVYRGGAIEIWRDGALYVSYQAPNQQSYSHRCDIYLGLRCIFGAQRYGLLQGAIDEARIYDGALSGEQIALLQPGVLSDPRPLGCWNFEQGVVDDVMGNFPPTQLIGTARVEDGVLLLDGGGFAWVTRRLPVEYLPPTVQAGFYTPPHRVGQMWDTWLYWHEGMYYMYYIAGPLGAWDAHEIAVSRDGVHWDYHGVAVRPRPETTWVGTGHVWPSPEFARTGLWILNYSEWVGDKQDIMFATSPDLLRWTKADERCRFVQDTRWYKEKGRWDCIDAIEGGDGLLYGYFTADPDPTKVDYQHCGFGCARSRDGIRWEALPPVEGDLEGEFGGIQQIGDRYFITMSEGRVGVGSSPRGPFWKQMKNHNVFGGDIYFPRFFHTAPDGPLMNHFFKDGPVFAAPLKALDVDDQGILRVVWWPSNERLKAVEVPVSTRAGAGGTRWLLDPLDVNRTAVIEGIARAVPRDRIGSLPHAFLIDQGDDTAQCVAFERLETLFGSVELDVAVPALTVRQRADRDLDFGSDQRFRIVINRDMMEVYVNDYLTVHARIRNTGRFGWLSGDAHSIEQVRVWLSAHP